MYPRPHSSSVRTWAPGRAAGSSRWLGELGPTTAPVYSWTVPGGYDQMSCKLIMPRHYRSDAMNPGRIVEIVRGASVIWFGKLDLPQHDGTGWNITAHGGGTLGTEWDAIYTTWSNQNDAVNQAITRGLRWVNPGIPGTVFLGQQQDSGSVKISDLLNLMCSKGGLTWWVGRDRVLTVTAVPTAVTRLLVSTEPPARTLAGDINALALRYQVSKDGAAAAVYATTFALNQPSINVHDRIEDYDDLAAAGQQTAAQAQATGANAFAHYQRAAYAAPFTVVPGQLLNPGGQYCDPGAEQPGMVCRLLVMDAAYGGEVSPAPATFPVGAYVWDDGAMTATIAAYQSFGLQGLVAASQLGPDAAEVRRKQAAAAARAAAARARAEAALDRKQARAAATAARRRLAASREAALDRRQAAAKAEAAQDKAQLAAWHLRHKRGKHPKF